MSGTAAPEPNQSNADLPEYSDQKEKILTNPTCTNRPKCADNGIQEISKKLNLKEQPDMAMPKHILLL